MVHQDSTGSERNLTFATPVGTGQEKLYEASVLAELMMIKDENLVLEFDGRRISVREMMKELELATPLSKKFVDLDVEERAELFKASIIQAKGTSLFARLKSIFGS